jgi:Skp family chaperone for outer membrane proteins
MNAIRRSWTQWTLMALVACLAIFVWEAVSDEPPPADRPHKVPVAVLDVGRAFKEGKAYNDKIENVKDEIEAFEREVRRKQLELTAAGPLPRDTTPSSGVDGERVEEANKLQADVVLKKQEFLNKEAKIYFDCYKSIEDAVQRVARERDIGVVIRHNAEGMDPANRASVLREVNRTVVYAAVPDITNDVLTELNGPKP